MQSEHEYHGQICQFNNNNMKQNTDEQFMTEFKENVCVNYFHSVCLCYNMCFSYGPTQYTVWLGGQVVRTLDL